MQIERSIRRLHGRITGTARIKAACFPPAECSRNPAERQFQKSSGEAAPESHSPKWSFPTQFTTNIVPIYHKYMTKTGADNALQTKNIHFEALPTPQLRVLPRTPTRSLPHALTMRILPVALN